MPRIITFGEIMGRLAPAGFLRFRQALPGNLEVTFAGAEANVAVSLALLGKDVQFVTALPTHAIADACVGTLRGLGVGTQHIVRTDAGRLGLYFLETGANQRAGQVIYDRDGSAVGRTPAAAYDWPQVFAGAEWFHVTGITPAISGLAAETAMVAVGEAKRLGLTVSCDLNFRKKLWRWEPGTRPRDLAERIMRRLLASVDVVIANEEDCAEVLDIRAGNTNVDTGRLDIGRYPEVARQLVRQFPQVARVAITLRQSLSASHNNWGAMLYEAVTDSAVFAPCGADGAYRPYEIRNIVDRVGGGDSFAAGLIYALSTGELAAPETAIRFAVAASCLAHSISGDFNYVSRAEVEQLMAGAGAGRVDR